MGDTARNYGVGVQSFGVWETVEGGRFDCVVFFPSLSRGREMVRDGWRLRAGEGARPFPGFYPLILLSHDAASSRYANSDLAVALAGSGFIVIAPTHAGDNQNDSDGLHTAGLLLTRPRQLLLALETVLASPVFAPYADESRIGLLGVGSGSVTALQSAGVRPDPGGMEAFCSHAAAYPDPSPDPFCTPWASSRLARLPDEAAALEAKWGDQAFTPPLDFYAPPLAPSPAQAAEDKQAVYRRPADSRRIRALALLAPAGGLFFPRDAAAGIPALIIEAGNDGLYAPDLHSRPYLSLLPPRTPVVRLAGADHFSLFAACSAEVRENLEAACGRMREDERLDARNRRDHELISFFKSVLGHPLEPVPPSGLVADPASGRKIFD
jgi:predicted dienelactone hydrolase